MGNSPQLSPAELKRRMLQDPEWYIRTILAQDPWEKQVEIVRSVLNNRRTSVRGCVGSTKTFAGALAVFAFMHAYAPAEVYVTAPTFRQVRKVPFKEIRKIHKRAAAPLDRRKLLDTEWKIDDDWFVLGVSPKDPDAIQGSHAPNILIWVDEAQGVQQELLEAFENAMAGENAHMLITYNPNASPGETAYECCHSQRHLWNNIKITADDVPNVKLGRDVIPGAISKAQRDEWVKTYGWDSNWVRVKVRAMYPKQDTDALIPIEWIEKAIHREVPDGRWVMGVDVARKGPDDTVLAPRCGRRVEDLVVIHGRDNVEVATAIERLVKGKKFARIFVDEIGTGSGVIDTLKHDKIRGAVGINVARKARKPEEFPNVRSESFWALREALDPKGDNPIALPNDLMLQGELSAMKYDHDRQNRIVVEDTASLKKRLKRSPDRAVAVNLANLAAASSAPVPSAGVDPSQTPLARRRLARLPRPRAGGS